MHNHLEIVMPKVDDVEKGVERLMAPFCEHSEARGKKVSQGLRFWDWYEIGGRWTGEKFIKRLDEDKLEEFNKKLTEMKVTVSGIQFGKQELSPKSQEPIVDKLWNEYFPQSNGKPFPMFRHSGKALSDFDVMSLSEVPKGLRASRVIFGKEEYSLNDKGVWKKKNFLRVSAMFSDSIWNGFNYEDTKWDGTFSEAVKLYKKSISGYRPDYRKLIEIKPDWLVVTVDYHN